jgi:hypothetical protein
MKVTIDVGVLMRKLQSANPQADLTSIKAYLFDLAFNPPNPDKTPEEFEEPEVSEEAESSMDLSSELPAPPVGLVQRTTPTPVTKSPVRKVFVAPVGNASPGRQVVGGKLTREEKLKKREEAQNLANMSTKELLATLTSKEEKDQRGENNQFVNEGSSHIDANGDLELG